MKVFCKILIVYLFLLLHFSSKVAATIYVKNQSDFNNISNLIYQSIKSGEKCVTIELKPGTYEFHETHIVLKDIEAPSVRLRIIGKGKVNIVPTGKSYKDGDPYDGVFNIDNSWMYGEQDVNIWNDAKYIDGLIEVVDENNKTCRFKSTERLPQNMDIRNVFVLIPEWFSSKVYKVYKIVDNYVYFIASDLKKSYNNGYNINDDFNYAKKSLRYRLCNIENGGDALLVSNNKIALPHNCNSIREGKVQTFIDIENCVLKNIEILNLNFHGNGARNNNALFYFNKVDSKKCEIRKCGFIGMRSGVIRIISSSNIYIENNSFKDCYYYGILSDNTSANTHVENNLFYEMGKSIQNSFCITCSGEDFSIKNNSFKDFGYGGIAVGVWYGSKKNKPCCGIVEKNELSYTDSYLNNIDDYGLMDGGAIYSYTQNDCTVIRNNFIHDISGAADNRGLFCDDGASGLLIYGNVVTRVHNSYCIDARRVSSVEKWAQASNVEHANINVEIYNNVVDGKVRFEANEMDNNGCKYGENFLLVAKEKDIPMVKISEVDKRVEDIILDYIETEKTVVEVPRSSYIVLKRSPVWKGIKGFVKK